MTVRDPLPELDQDQWNAERDAAARERRQRRHARRQTRGPARLPKPSSRSVFSRIGSPFAALGPLRASRSGRTLIGLTAGLLVLTLIGLAMLWPGTASERPGGRVPASAPTRAAEVAAVKIADCGGPVAQRCVAIDVRLDDGPERGRRATITLGPVGQVSELQAGDGVRVTRIPLSPELVADPSVEPYALAGIERRGAIGWLLAAFVVLVLVFARWRGVLSLIGFALSLGLVTQFLVPAMLDGSSPVLVALTGSMAVMFVTLGLTYGVAAASLAAALGITASLALAAALSRLWVEVAHLDGRSSELGSLLAQRGDGLSLQGIVLAGMVIGALGVLADTGVTQASAVMALRRADPTMGARAVYREAFAVGRDHLTATIHTLVLAYVGASLPLILVLSQAGVSTTDALNSESIAEPIIATLVGSIALLASVPLTTGLAAMLMARIPAAVLPTYDGHAHHHH